MTGTAEHAWKMCRVRLEAAREPGAAPGTGDHGYDFVAPLDESGHISVEGWKRERALCFVHRTERGAVVERGTLRHRPGGAEGATWMFDYNPLEDGDEEAGYRFGAHAFTQGEYVSIRDADGHLRTYRIASVRPA